MFKKTVIFIVTICTAFTIQTKQLLRDYAFNAYSQFGEDGIIKKAFEIIGTSSKICVEFGAWDGIHLSNTANLWLHDKAWKAYLIEADKNKFQSLLSTTRDHENCYPIQAWVGADENNCLEKILEKKWL